MRRFPVIWVVVSCAACTALFGVDELVFDSPSTGSGGAGGVTMSSGGSGGGTASASGGGTASASGGGARIDLGQPCRADLDCSSRSCVDGFCCESDCTTKCSRCDKPLDEGQCVAASVGTDPHRDCASGQRCDAEGQCYECNGKEPNPASGCPAPCTECKGGICFIKCHQSGACGGDNLQCPPGYDCAVECHGQDSCKDATIDCGTTGNGCTVTCTDKAACSGMALNCNDSACAVQCGVELDSCYGQKIVCGKHACTATCNGSSEPNLECGDSCDCQPCAPD